VSDAVPLLEVGDGRERISPLLTRRRPCSIWSDDAAPWRPSPTCDRRGLGSSDGAAQRWGALAGDAGAEMGGRDGRSWRSRGGRAARGARRLPELWTRRDWESTGVGWGLPPAGAVGAVVWGLHRAPAGAAGRRRRSAVGAPRVFYFDRDIFLGDEANKHELRSVL